MCVLFDTCIVGVYSSAKICKDNAISSKTLLCEIRVFLIVRVSGKNSNFLNFYNASETSRDLTAVLFATPFFLNLNFLAKGVGMFLVVGLVTRHSNFIRLIWNSSSPCICFPHFSLFYVSNYLKHILESTKPIRTLGLDQSFAVHSCI